MRDAIAFGNAAPQSGNEGPGSEDCLFLNITTPALHDGGKRPILVYIHGGGYNNGSGSDPLYDGSHLSRHGNVVVITLNHRLNAFGYLHLADFGERYAASGNAGQLDLVQALQWVREHAGEFGGDASNITLFGQSGGGAKIATLMAMPAARGLFHRAWTMSGQQVTAAGPRAASQRAHLLLDAAGVRDADALSALPMAQVLAACSARDPSRIEDMGLYFGPVLDGKVLPVHPFYPEAPAQSAGIPMVIGNTHDETRNFLGKDPANHTLSWAQLPEKLLSQQYVDLPVAEVIDEYRRLYPDYSASQVFFAATTAGRSWRGAVLEAEARARQQAPTWVYQLDFGSPLDGGRWGAMHTLDIPLLFGTINATGSMTGVGPAAQHVSAAMVDSLLAFARSGNPNADHAVAWPQYTLARRETLLFDDPPQVALDPRGGERRLYARAPFVQRGTQ